MRFVVTGTGRNGTGYVAELFTAAGLPCGHEDWFGVRAGIRDVQAMPRRRKVSKLASPLLRVREEIRRRRLPIQGDASWMAVPRLGHFPGVAFLQLRHPLKVIRSFIGTGFFTDSSRYVSQRRFAAAHFDIVGDDVVDSMRWWVYWNMKAADHADMTYPIEGLDVDLFARMLEMVGLDQAKRRASAAIDRVPENINSSAHRGTQLGEVMSWSDLPTGRDRDQLSAAASRFGYVPDDPSVRPSLIERHPGTRV